MLTHCSRATTNWLWSILVTFQCDFVTLALSNGIILGRARPKIWTSAQNLDDWFFPPMSHIDINQRNQGHDKLFGVDSPPSSNQFDFENTSAGEISWSSKLIMLASAQLGRGQPKLAWFPPGSRHLRKNEVELIHVSLWWPWDPSVTRISPFNGLSVR